jgi:hypothetical protein
MKNLKAEDWMWIGQEIKRRDALGKVSEPCLWGRPLPWERVTRELGRHGAAILALQTRGRMPEILANFCWKFRLTRNRAD